jgi:hypothetical protein
MNNRTEISQMEFNRYEIFVLFNYLFISKPIFRAEYEALWRNGFRERLEFWGIDYKNDLIALDIPEILENKEE